MDFWNGTHTSKVGGGTGRLSISDKWLPEEELTVTFLFFFNIVKVTEILDAKSPKLSENFSLYIYTYTFIAMLGNWGFSVMVPMCLV